MDNRLTRIHAAADYVRGRIGSAKPVAGIVLGSGLGKLADSISNPIVIPYKEVPELPVSTAIGHKGNFIIGQLGGKTVIAMQGRFHFYEGYSMDQVTMGIRVMALLGIKVLFVSNAAGAANLSYKVGDLAIIKDHINLLPNPLIGPNMEEFGPRFPDMTCPYDPALIAQAKSIASSLGISLQEGVYFGSTGPTYETPAEVRFYKTIGADLLGMSTVPEVIVARHCGLRVFGMSVVTNVSNYDTSSTVLNDEEDVVLQADRAADRMCAIFTKLLEQS